MNVTQNGLESLRDSGFTEEDDDDDDDDDDMMTRKL